MFLSGVAPLGIIGITRRKQIDVDEFGLEIRQCNSKQGYALSCYRVRKPGHYLREEKLTILFAIEPGDHCLPPSTRGNIYSPRRWITVLRATGTSALAFADFIQSICTDIEGNSIGRDLDEAWRNILWDNLHNHIPHQLSRLIFPNF